MPALLSRLGAFSARHRVSVVIAWVLTLGVLAAITLTSMRFSDAGFDVPGTDSSRAMQTLEDEFGSSDTAPSLQLVIQSPRGPIGDDTEQIVAVRESVSSYESVSAVSDPFDPMRPMVSPDGSTVVMDVTFQKDLSDADAETASEHLEEVAVELRATGLTAEIGGQLGGEIPEILGPSELVGAALAFLVLMITFGSLVAAGANMLGSLIGVGVGVLGVLASSAITPIGTVTPILAVMLGLAVGIDYGLFVLSRFRSELRAGRTVLEAVTVACGTAGSAVAFAGATVIIALVGLTVVGIPFLAEMGLAAAVAVAVAVLMSLTLLPALMSIVGRSSLPRSVRRRRTSGDEEGAKWAIRWGAGVTRRPILAIIGTILVLGVVAVPIGSMNTSLVIPGGEDPKSTQRAAYDLIAEEFGAGAQDPLVVLVRADDTEAVAESVATAISGLKNVDRVIPSGIAANGEAALLTVMAESGPLDDATIKLVRDIRALSNSEADVQVTGSTALSLDSDGQLRGALIAYIALIVGLSIILLVLLFRSILVPLVATAGFMLSLGAGLGATVAVFQWGWLDSLVQAPQGNPLLSLLPIIVTGILFGLAMDYQVFLVTRIHEAYRHGETPAEAVRTGFRRAAPVVVAAAAIMTAVFGGFALSPSSLVGSIALALAVGVVADAIFVRMLLVPAALTLMGRAAWWLPRWADRVLPHLDVEGETTSRPDRDAKSHQMSAI